MFQEQINQVVNEISNLQDMQPADLKLLTERYPYCQITQVLLAKKLHSINNPSFEKQLQKTSAIIFDRNVLFEIIENMPLRTSVAAGFDQEEEIKPEINQVRHDEIIHEELLQVDEEVKEEEIIQQPIQEAPVMIHEQISEEVFDQIISDHGNEIPENKIEELALKETKIESVISEETVIRENDLNIDEPTIEEEVELNQEEVEAKKDIISEEPLMESEEFVQSDEPIKDEEIQINEEIISDEPVMELKQFVQSDEPIKNEEIQINEEIISEEVERELKEKVQSDEPVKEEEQIEKPVVKAEPEFDEPLFEMPGYNIERELGTLDEKDEIRIKIQKPVLSEEIIQEPIPAKIPFETQLHSFANWFETIGMQNRAKVVELKTEQMPVRQTVHPKEPPVQKTKEVVQPVKTDVVTEQIAGELAKKSLQFDDRLASETYARILYMQGKYAKAIEMYEKLSLLKPAKSDYFAALIEQIKKRK